MATAEAMAEDMAGDMAVDTAEDMAVDTVDMVMAAMVDILAMVILQSPPLLFYSNTKQTFILTLIQGW